VRLRAAAASLHSAAPTQPLAAVAFARCAAPWQVVVVGRRSAGKTSLINRIAGTDHPVGLGGVTTAAHTTALADAALVDTPGLGGRGAVDRLMPLVDDADAVLWVVDGLHPLTLSERRVLRECLLPGTAIHIVVTHLDLIEPHDVDAVLERVRTLTAPLGVRSVSRIDLRSATLPPATLVQSEPSSPARRRAVRRAADAVAAELDAAGPPWIERLRADARAAWQEAVAEVRDALERDVALGLVHTGAAAERLHARAPAAVEAASTSLLALHRPDDLDAPRLPMPPARARSLMGDALGGWGGEEEVRRLLRARVAGWLADGELALVEWLEGSAALAGEVGRRAHTRAAVAEARAVLAGGRT
jgi:GTP-binding protein EngB required for normal cell division